MMRQPVSSVNPRLASFTLARNCWDSSPTSAWLLSDGYPAQLAQDRRHLAHRYPDTVVYKYRFTSSQPGGPRAHPIGSGRRDAYRPRADVRRLGFGTAGPTKVRLLHHPLDALQIKKKSCDFSQPIVSSGAGDRIRTYDHLITNQLLYRLSYASMSDMPLRPPIARCICVQAVSIRASSVGNDRLGRVIEGHPGRWHR